MQKFSEKTNSKLRQRTVGCLLLVAVSTASYASDPVLIYCSNCSPSQVSAAVMNVSAPIGTIIYVGDTVTGAVGAYDVYADVDDSHRPPIHAHYVENATADAHIVSLLHSAIGFYKAAPIGWQKTVRVTYDESASTSVYTIVDAGKDQNDFNAWIQGSLGGSLTQGFAAAFQLVTALHLVDAGALPNLVEPITFSDGSHIDAVYDKVSGKLKADPDSARDADNNTVPYLGADGKVHGLGGHFKFNDENHGVQDYNNFVHQVQSLGVPITLGSDPANPGHSGGGTTHGWGCTESENHVFTCWSS